MLQSESLDIQVAVWKPARAKVFRYGLSRSTNSILFWRLGTKHSVSKRKKNASMVRDRARQWCFAILAPRQMGNSIAEPDRAAPLSGSVPDPQFGCKPLGARVRAPLAFFSPKFSSGIDEQWIPIESPSGTGRVLERAACRKLHMYQGGTGEQRINCCFLSFFHSATFCLGCCVCSFSFSFFGHGSLTVRAKSVSRAPRLDADEKQRGGFGFLIACLLACSLASFGLFCSQKGLIF